MARELLVFWKPMSEGTWRNCYLDSSPSVKRNLDEILEYLGRDELLEGDYNLIQHVHEGANPYDEYAYRQRG